MADDNEFNLPEILPKEPTVPAWAALLLRRLTQVDDLTRVAIKGVQDLNIKVDSIDARLCHVETTSYDNNRTLRGHNGDPGVVGQIATINESMKWIRDLEEKGGLQGKPDEVSKFLSWAWIADKLAAPLIVSMIVLACPAVTVIAVLLPTIISHLIPAIK